MNKFKLVIVLLISFSSAVSAQQKPYYTQYILNNYILNPALSGIENYTDVKLSYRNQWAGIDGAPVTMYFSVQGPINKSDTRTTATSYQIPGTNSPCKIPKKPVLFLSVYLKGFMNMLY